MDDNGNLIYYIVLGIIYLASRFFGKKKKQPVKSQPKRPAGEPQTQRETRPIQAPTAEKEEAPMSFEDILRELSGGSQPKPEPDPEPVTYSAPTVQEVKMPSYAEEMDSRPQPSYAIDEMDSIAGSYDIPKPFGSGKRLPEVESAEDRRTDLTFKRTSHYTIEDEETINYSEIISQPNGAAKAFVLGEIFNRKY